MRANRFLAMIIAVLSWPVVSIAGAVSGGGGSAVACYDESGNLTSAQSLDLYEGRSIFGDKLLSSDTADIQGHLDLALQRLEEKTGYGIWVSSKVRLNKFTKWVLEKKRFISESDRLKRVDDSFEGFIPANCKVEQAAVFFDENNIAFDKRIWNAMSELDRAGLILHEAVYWYERIQKSEFDSRRSRRVVSLALSKEWKFDSVLDLPSSYLMCANLEGENRTIFAVYKKAGRQIMHFFALGGDFALSFKAQVVAVENFPFLEDLSDATHYGVGLTTYSKYENRDELKLRRVPVYSTDGKIIGQNITIGGSKTSYPKRDIVPVQVMCRQQNL